MWQCPRTRLHSPQLLLPFHQTESVDELHDDLQVGFVSILTFGQSLTVGIVSSLFSWVLVVVEINAVNCYQICACNDEKL